MAIRTFNSVGGFSVGELATTVIDSTGIGSFTSIKTDNLLRADGNVWDLQQAAGNSTYIQFNTDNNFAATANLTFVTSANYDASLDAFRVIGNISSNNISASNSISAIGNITTNGNFSALGNVSIGGNVSITGNMSVGTITGNLVGNVTGNVTGNFAGNVTGNFSGNITGGATISAPGSDTNVIFNDGSKIEAAPGLKYIKAVVEDLGNSIAAASSRVEVTGVFSAGSITGDLNPTVNYGGNLGNATHAWKDLWLSGTTINLGTQTISSNGTGTTLTGVSSMATLVVTGANTTTDAATGALVVAGGVGVGGNIYVTGKANVEGDVLIGKAGPGNAASANVTGNLQVGGSATVTGNITISGDLTVGGNTTYVNTTNTSITDAIIDLGGAGSGANLAGSAVGDRGLLLHGSSAVNQFMGWNTGNSEFQMQKAVSVGAESGVVTGTAANLRIDTLQSANVFGTVQTAVQPNITTMLGLTDTTTTTANITTATITTAGIGTLTASGLLYPTADGAAPATNEVTVLSTDGDATLGFSTIHTDRIANATSSVMVNSNGSTAVSFNGNLVFTVIATGANVTGVLTSSTSVDTPTVNAATAVVTPKVSIGTTALYSATANTATTTSTVIASVVATTCRAVDFFVKGEDTAGEKYTVATITAIHYGSDVDFTVHSKLHAGTGAAGSFTVELVGGSIQLKATATSTTNTVWTTQIRTI